MLIHDPFFLVLASVGLTLSGKYVWDRWLSQNSRVSAQKCLDNQAICSAKITAKISELSSELTCGEENFKKIREHQERTSHTLKVILMALVELCEQGEGCREQTREDLRREVLR